MKGYTDIEQSKKLAEILPIESADMHYATWTILNGGEFIVSQNQGSTIKDLQEDFGNQIIPYWSLATLIEQLPAIEGGRPLISLALNGDCDISYVHELTIGIGILYVHASNLLDACYEMILKLKEKDLL